MCLYGKTLLSSWKIVAVFKYTNICFNANNESVGLCDSCFSERSLEMRVTFFARNGLKQSLLQLLDNVYLIPPSKHCSLNVANGFLWISTQSYFRHSSLADYNTAFRKPDPTEIKSRSFPFNLDMYIVVDTGIYCSSLICCLMRALLSRHC